MRRNEEFIEIGKNQKKLWEAIKSDENREKKEYCAVIRSSRRTGGKRRKGNFAKYEECLFGNNDVKYCAMGVAKSRI